ncbi:polysaccharide deacetylase family protein [Nocardia sp. CDC159]|uniref:Polysaccharide deacetylase family protein n=1 Tax=Nocardia pulmonis TaxID=2951408 RepID=A0A9X2E4Q7_9NOCA|nr:MULTISPECIES: polysaccharide deacetylase family protein [Nocardia]MCM6773043.1 polysaccharide deacetylase family protein [Nocardia pulmonis]MCM6785654.1 polysaccharide deacetylase family protein [Nocardia sp. CDC159]
MVDKALSRRGLLAAGAALAAGFAASGCGATQADTSSSRIASATPEPAPSRAVPVRAQPVRSAVPDAVAARFAGRQPTRWGMDLPGIMTTIPAQGKQMALTFDACGGPDNDEMNDVLVNFLIQQQIPATLFLNKRWIDADWQRAERLAANPLFELANHGTRHCPLSVNGHAAYGIAGTASARQAVDEVWGNHETLTRLLGHPPRFFRTGTAHYDEVAVEIVRELGEQPVGFSVNADGGATYSAGQVQQAMATVRPGAISIAHMHRPHSGTAPGMLVALPKLRAQGYEFVELP